MTRDRFLCAFVALVSVSLLPSCGSTPKAPPTPAPATPAVNPTSPTAPIVRKPAPPNAAEMEEAASKRSPAIGGEATEFSLLNPDSQPVKLSDFKGKWTVLYFYPADDTPGCTCQATEFTDLLARFHHLNAVVVGVSPDPPILHQIFMRKYDLKLTLLSDQTKETLKAYGAWQETKVGDRKVERVLRSTFLIDPDGTIAWHWPEVIPQGHAERVRDRLAKISAEREKKAVGR